MGGHAELEYSLSRRKSRAHDVRLLTIAPPVSATIRPFLLNKNNEGQHGTERHVVAKPREDHSEDELAREREQARGSFSTERPKDPKWQIERMNWFRAERRAKEHDEADLRWLGCGKSPLASDAIVHGEPHQRHRKTGRQMMIWKTGRQDDGRIERHQPILPI